MMDSKNRWLREDTGDDDPDLGNIEYDMISENRDNSYAHDARTDANGLFWNLKSFTIHLVILRHVISYTLPLTYELELQKKANGCLVGVSCS